MINWVNVKFKIEEVKSLYGQNEWRATIEKGFQILTANTHIVHIELGKNQEHSFPFCS